MFRVLFLTAAHPCVKYNPQTYTPRGKRAVLSSSVLYNFLWASLLLCWYAGLHTDTHTHTHTHTNHWSGLPALHILMQISVAGVGDEWQCRINECWVLQSLASVIWLLLTWSWAMLKLDLTGHSSHVSFSRNILSSSSRALRGWEEMKGNGGWRRRAKS